MFNLFSPKPLRHPIPLIWSGWGGIHFSDDGGHTEKAFWCEGMSRLPAFSFIGDSLVYIAHPTSVVLLSQHGKKELLLPMEIPEQWGVTSIFPTKDGLFLNLCHAGEACAVWNVNAENGEISVLNNVTEIRCAENSDAVATRNGVRFFVGDDLVQIPPKLDRDIVNWDYDPIENCFCIATRDFLCILNKQGWKRVKLSRSQNINNIYMNRELKQILVSGNLPFYAYFGGVVRAYSYSGQFLNTILQAFPFIGRPILRADENALLILNRFNIVAN